MLDNGLFDQFSTPLSAMRLQSQLGKETKRMYKEGQNIVRLSLARVVKVNYKYNTVDVITTLHKNTTAKSPTDNGKFSARLPISFGGTTPDGKVYGSNTLVTIGSLVLVGFMEGNKDHPIVLNIYGDTHNQSQLTRTSFTSADESDESLQRELWQLFTLYPSMTYTNKDGHGNQEVTFSGKSFMYITDTDPDNDYVNDAEFDYDLLPSSRYANGDLIEPKSPNSPTLLYVHQGIYDKHRVTFFIKSDGTVRLGSRHSEGTGVTFMEMTTDGAFQITQKKDTTNPEESVEKFSKIGIEADGSVVMKSANHTLEVTEEGVMVDGKPIISIGGGVGGGTGEGGTINFEEILGDLTSLKTTITVINGKIETTISREEYELDMEAVQKHAEELVAGAKKEIADLTEVVENLDLSIDEAFFDGLISEAEAQTIASHIQQLKNEKADVDAKYTELVENSYLSATGKAQLETAKAAYDSFLINLVDSITLAISDKKASEEEKAAVDQAFVDYRLAIANLSSAFQQAADAISLAQAKQAEGNAKSYTESSFTQLADRISSKVSSDTFTKVTEDTNTKIADMEKAFTEDIDRTNGRVDEVEKNVTYDAQVFSTNGLVFKNGIIETTLFCRVFHGKDDITDTIEASRFNWIRVSDGDDDTWNADPRTRGVKSLRITADDVTARATFNCEVLDENNS